MRVGVMERVLGPEIERRGADPQALQAAWHLQAAYPECAVILFGSRARADWDRYSDVDLMLVGDIGTAAQQDCRAQAYRLACAAYAVAPPAPDLKFLTLDDYYEQIQYSRNRIGAVAHREGILMGRFHSRPELPEDGAEPNPENRESAELADRLRDAHVHYGDMQGLLDSGRLTKNCVFQAHQALEHGLKALITARGGTYPHVHDLTGLARQCDLALRSDRQLLAEYAGGPRCNAPPFPSIDFPRLANDVTADLDLIFQQVRERTGVNPWDMNEAYGTRERPGLTPTPACPGTFKVERGGCPRKGALMAATRLRPLIQKVEDRSHPQGEARARSGPSARRRRQPPRSTAECFSMDLRQALRCDNRTMDGIQSLEYEGRDKTKGEWL